VGMTAFGWVIEALNERTGLLGIGLILFIMAAVAAGFRDGLAKGHRASSAGLSEIRQ
jgi:hypothetical protein